MKHNELCCPTLLSLGRYVSAGAGIPLIQLVLLRPIVDDTLHGLKLDSIQRWPPSVLMRGKRSANIFFINLGLLFYRRWRGIGELAVLCNSKSASCGDPLTRGSSVFDRLRARLSTMKRCPARPVEEAALLKGRADLPTTEPDQARKRAVVKWTPRRWWDNSVQEIVEKTLSEKDAHLAWMSPPLFFR